LFVRSSGILALEPMEAFEFYLWVFEKNKGQPNWIGFQPVSKVGNRIHFKAAYRLLGAHVEFEGVAVLSPERSIEFSVNKISDPRLRAEPALIRYTFHPVSGGTLVTKTWHFMFTSKTHVLYEWLVALQVKRHLSLSFRADARNLQLWGGEMVENRALPISA
jgi:hypothetical protein